MDRIRLATATDAEAIRRLHAAAIEARVAGHYEPALIASWVGHLKPALYAQPIAESRLWVAEADGRVRAFGQLSQDGDALEALYVDPEHQSRGHGRALLGFLEDRARAAGKVQLHLSASRNAVRFYRRSGYRVLGETELELPYGGRLRCVAMIKGLPSPLPAKEIETP